MIFEFVYFFSLNFETAKINIPDALKAARRALVASSGSSTAIIKRPTSSSSGFNGSEGGGSESSAHPAEMSAIERWLLVLATAAVQSDGLDCRAQTAPAYSNKTPLDLLGIRSD